MKISGKITHVLKTETGESKNGTWQKRTIVIQKDADKYPKPIAVQLWGDLAQNALSVGDEVELSINIESRSWKDKWFTDVRAWKIDSLIPSGMSNPEEDFSDLDVDESGQPLPF